MKISSRGWVIITTILIIGLFFAIYFLVYVKKQEEHLSGEGYRALRQISLGINALEQTFLANAKSMAQKQGNSADINPFLKKGTDKKRFTQPINYQSDSLFFHVEGIKVDQVGEITVTRTARAQSHQTAQQDQKISYSKFGMDTLEIVQSIAVPIIRRHTKVLDAPTTADYRISYEDFFGKSKLNWRYDVFDHYIILMIDEVDQAIEIDYLYKTFFNEISYDSINQVIGQGTLRPSFKAKISNVDYLVFNHVLDEDQNIYVSGLIRESTFNSRKKSISPTFLICSGLTILFLLLSMPLLKLSFMSNEERLNSLNVIFVGVSLSFGPAILLLLHFTLVNYFFDNYSKLDDQLIQLNDNIESNFKHEIFSLHRQKEVYDLALNQAIEDKFNADSILGTDLEPKIYNFFNYGFWANGNGQVKSQISTFENAPFAGNLSHRKYVTEVLTRPYQFTHRGKSIDFMIESIRSVSDGSFEAGVGFRSLMDTIVFAFSTKLNSVMDPVLEPGFGFCIFDQQGLVQFHSEITKNLNENFLEEVDYDPSIMSTLNSQIASMETARYSGSNNRIYVKPMTDIPFYIATFHNRQNYRAPFSQALSTSFLLFLINYAALGIVLLILIIPNIHQNKLEQKEFLFHWIRPIRNAHYFKLYKSMFFINLGGAFYMYLMGEMYNDLPVYNLMNVINILAIILVYSYKLLKKPLPRAFNISKPNLNRIAPFLLFVPIIIQWLINPYGLANLVNTAALIYALFYRQKGVDDSEKKIELKPFSKAYIRYVLSWLILISVVPSLIFYQISFKQEVELMKKYGLNGLMEAYDSRQESIYIEFSEKIPNGIEKIVDGRNKFGNYALTVSMTMLDTIPTGTEKPTNDILLMQGEQVSINDSIASQDDFEEIYYHLKPGFDALITSSKGFTYNHAEDSSWKSGSDLNRIYLQKNFKSPSANSQLMATTEVPVLFDSLQFWLLFFGGFVSIVIIYRQVIIYSIGKMFGLDYITIADRRDEDIQRFVEHWKDKSHEHSQRNNNLIVIGLHHSGKVGFIRDLLGEPNLEFDDFNEIIPESDFIAVKRKGQDSIVIEHFEYKYQDHKTNLVKLKALQSLVNQEASIILTSEINPSQIFWFYDKHIDIIKAQLTKNSGDSDYRKHLEKVLEDYKSAYHQWQYVLGGFKKVYVPLNYQKESKELDFGSYLESMQGHYQDEDERSYEDKIIDIQVTSHPYYHAIWNSLPKEERYIVYDLAKDSFLNSKNVTSIVNLIKKGVLVYDHSLRLMNNSFTNFVLTQVRTNEALEMEMKIREKGSWNTISMVIILIIISIVFFLSFGQQNFLDDINALLTALATVVGLAIRFGGIFSFGYQHRNDN